MTRTVVTATCPVCTRKSVTVLKSGGLRGHTRWPRYGRGPKLCEGSRQRPDDAALAARAPLMRAAQDAADLYDAKTARVSKARRDIVEAEAAIAAGEPMLPRLRADAEAARAALVAHDAAAKDGAS